LEAAGFEAAGLVGPLPPDEDELHADRARSAVMPAAAIESRFIFHNTDAGANRFSAIGDVAARPTRLPVWFA
jgi:hypothetical protein